MVESLGLEDPEVEHALIEAWQAVSASHSACKNLPVVSVAHNGQSVKDVSGEEKVDHGHIRDDSLIRHSQKLSLGRLAQWLNLGVHSVATFVAVVHSISAVYLAVCGRVVAAYYRTFEPETTEFATHCKLLEKSEKN